LYGELSVVASDLTTISTMPNDRRAVLGWRPTEDRHVQVLTDILNASP